MRFAIILASIPALTFGGGYVLTPPSPPLVASAVTTEGIRAQRMDDSTFHRRWSPIVGLMSGLSVLGGHVSPTRSERDLPEAGSVSNAATGEPEARKTRHTIEVRRVATTAVDNAGTVMVSPPAPPSSRRLRSRAVRLDICARHGMRKVSYGKRWRCRR